MRHFCSGVVAVLHETTCTSVMFFDFLKPNPMFSSIIVRYLGSYFVSHSVAGISNPKGLLETI